VSQDDGEDPRKDGKFTACLEMLKTSQTIEQVLPFEDQCGNTKKEAAIRKHCHNNMMHNQIKLICQKGLLAAKVPNSAWPLILKEFSDIPDVLYYLLQ
jgi:predicted Rossmann fold nucleotide-binding protein DprA/Smf involved in DNA uptake